MWFPALALRRNTDRHYFQLMFHVVRFYNMGIITIFIATGKIYVPYMDKERKE